MPASGRTWSATRVGAAAGALSRTAMLKIARSVNGGCVTFSLSGRIKAACLAEFQALLDAETHGVALDLREVTLVDRDTIDFLARCEDDGVELRNCPGYIREWLHKRRARRKSR
jgi:hypothetical protein